MKILLLVSLVANVILGVLYYQEKTQPPIERIILEEKPAKIIREEVKVPVREPPKSQKKGDEQTAFLNRDDSTLAQDYEEAVENIETAKKDYLVHQLGLSEDILKKEGKLRSDFIRASNEIYERAQMGEVSIADRRRVLDLEEELQKNVVNLYGKANWQKFQNYQKSYNQQIIKRSKEDNAPAILMGP